MSVSCWWVERQLSLRAAEGSPRHVYGRLARHLNSCSKCAAAARDYERLTGGLESLSQPLPDGSRLKQAVFNSIEQNPAPRTQFRLSVGLAGAAAIAMVIIAITREPKPHATQSVSTAALPAPAPSPPRQISSAAPRKPSVEPAGANNIKPRPANRRTSRTRRRIRVRRVFRFAAAVPVRRTLISQPEDKTPAKRPAEQLVSRTITWERVGAWYEQSGYQTAALAAYSEAYRERPDPGLAYRAGTMAESSGDISTAIDFYARALEPAAQEGKEPQKGSSRCLETRGSA